MIADNSHEVVNSYGRAVSEEGNTKAIGILHEVFEPVNTPWRGLGTIPESGLGFREEFAAYDAIRRFGLEGMETGAEPKGCACGEVLRGLMDPPQCPLFGKACTPDSPVGSCMVSSEGSCAAWFKYSS